MKDHEITVTSRIGGGDRGRCDVVRTGVPTAEAQQRPADLTALPPVPTDYTPGKTSWGD